MLFPKLFVFSNGVDFVVVLFSFLWLFFTQFLFGVVCSVLFRVLYGSFLSSACNFVMLVSWTIFHPSLLFSGCLLSSLLSSDAFT